MDNLFKEPKVLEKMLSGVGAIYFGICGFLHEKYKQEFEDETAVTLACVVINELFFNRENRPDHNALYQQGLVESALKNLNNYEEIKEPYTQALRILNIIETQATDFQISCLKKMAPFLKKISQEEAVRRCEKALDFGIFVEGGMAPQLDEFIDLAKSFSLKWVGKK